MFEIPAFPAFSSKAFETSDLGRSSDLFPIKCLPIEKQWLLILESLCETHSSGTVQDFHLIPF